MPGDGSGPMCGMRRGAVLELRPQDLRLCQPDAEPQQHAGARPERGTAADPAADLESLHKWLASPEYMQFYQRVSTCSSIRHIPEKTE